MLELQFYKPVIIIYAKPMTTTETSFRYSGQDFYFLNFLMDSFNKQLFVSMKYKVKFWQK